MSEDPSEYLTVLEIVVENPGVDTESFRETVSEQRDDPDTAVELLERAVEADDIVEADGKHWIVRKGMYAYHSYDHPEPE